MLKKYADATAGPEKNQAPLLWVPKKFIHRDPNQLFDLCCFGTESCWGYM